MFYFMNIGSHCVALAYLELTIYTYMRLALNSRDSSVSASQVRIKCVLHHPGHLKVFEGASKMAQIVKLLETQ